MRDNVLKRLEDTLRSLSHSEEALKKIREFSGDLRDTKERMALFNADGAIVRSPIQTEQTRELGFDGEDDHFVLLQGDVVSTESGYFLGERITGNPKYVVLNSSCDLVPNRRKCASLARVKEVRESEEKTGAKLDLLLRFKRSDSMYLPVLPNDRPEVLCNVIDFDGICQIQSGHLMLANRIASLSLVGWRMFASFSRFVLTRANPREAEMRQAIEQHSGAGSS
ncbi:MAG TPA: hypothetical protein VMU80_18210 [Bryobacteraceae bacterium]|nr:hypothetical protein [Bryobacteraceae bacterium]